MSAGGVSESAALTNCPANREQLIVHYAQLGYSSKEILVFLTDVHGFQISLRHLYRLRLRLGVGARRKESPLSTIEAAIKEELKESGSLLGYRSMWHRLQMTHHLSVRRDTVMALLALIDPEGSLQRKKRKLKRRVYRCKVCGVQCICTDVSTELFPCLGPNFVWHCDGYDKLKPFGIAIHGCIDGYSRRIMWLTAAKSNNRPQYIAHHFVSCVRAVGGCPRLLRTDLGTENSIIAIVQPVLRDGGVDTFAGGASHRYGASPANQRIEALWSQLRKHCTQWWIEYFREFEAEGHFNSGVFYHMDAVRYCFGPLIQKDLTAFTTWWNNHAIRESRFADAPGGEPEMLYHMPHLMGADDYLCPVDGNILSEVENAVSEAPVMCTVAFKNLADQIVQDLGMTQPTDAVEASRQFFCLTQLIENL